MNQTSRNSSSDGLVFTDASIILRTLVLGLLILVTVVGKFFQSLFLSLSLQLARTKLDRLLKRTYRQSFICFPLIEQVSYKKKKTIEYKMRFETRFVDILKKNNKKIKERQQSSKVSHETFSLKSWSKKKQEGQYQRYRDKRTKSKMTGRKVGGSIDRRNPKRRSTKNTVKGKKFTNLECWIIYNKTRG